jgi:hypothetical protein
VNTGAAPTPDADLRQTDDASRARRAYLAAAQKVASLIQRYGVPTVLSWLNTGLPAAAK